VAIRERACTIRAAGIIFSALVASIAGTSHDARAQTTSPSVTSISPNRGSTAGGTLVNISGNNFTGETAVKFCGTSATSFNVNSATSITAISPVGSGTVDVTVTNSEGTSPASPGDQFTYGLVAATTASSREMQVSATPIIAQISGQALVGAIDSAIDAGFSGNPQTVTPNGGGFTFHIALDQPAANTGGSVGNRGGAGIGSLANPRQGSSGGAVPGSLANGK
jgi:hypothetical protein